MCERLWVGSVWVDGNDEKRVSISKSYLNFFLKEFFIWTPCEITLTFSCRLMLQFCHGKYSHVLYRVFNYTTSSKWCSVVLSWLFNAVEFFEIISKNFDVLIWLSVSLIITHFDEEWLAKKVDAWHHCCSKTRRKHL